MIGTFYINGEPADGRIPVTDSSVLRGDACFEVLKAYGGKPFGLEEHLDRLEFSAKALGIPLPPRDISSWVSRSAEEVGDCAVRVVATRGGSVPGVDDPSRVIVFSHTWPRPGDTTTLLPVTAPWHAAGVDWDLAGAKVTSYAPNVSATRRARSEGFGDALLIGVDGQMLEGPTFAVAWVVDDRMETTSLSMGILDSITRRVVLDSARNMGVEVVEGSWTLDRLDKASEALAMSTIREVQGVTAIGSRSFDPGPVTSQLADAYEELTRSL
jgi:branched-chain amino acid aminotransferase